MATSSTVTISISSSVSGGLNATDAAVMSTIVGTVANYIEVSNNPVASSGSLVILNLNNIPLTITYTIAST